MANEIQELLKEIKDERLRSRLSAAVAELRKTKKFGLVFEEHLPELLPIYSARIRIGARVARRDGRLTETYSVQKIAKSVATLAPEAGGAPQECPVEELVVVKRFGEAIFPALRQVESVLRGGDAAHHTLIEADNYHALQLLDWLYAGKVDCIYIDPPYNSGARDWKYNNDYVDSNDGWRHSKWLAFMQRRLKLAKRLLNPDGSVLIVTIDEKEYLRLGLLLEELFPGCNIQMTTIVINPKGTARYNEFARVEEYAFFVFVGAVRLQSFGSDMLTERDYSSETHVRWRGLARTGRKGLRSNNPGSWYPIFLNKSDFSIHSIGDAIGKKEKESSVPVPKGTIAVWPQTKHGDQYSWSTVPETLRLIHAKGGFKTGRINHDKKSYPFYYLSSVQFAKIAKGEIVETGRGPSNELIVEYAAGSKSAAPRSVWNKVIYDAGSHGTGLLQQIIPGGKFPFPKSIYSVRDAIRFFVSNKPDALILDYFAGSGTTLNAVTLLNAADSGRRRCILVTNNEVSAREVEALHGKTLNPGDEAYESQGICRSVTFPRCKFSINGKRDDGTELSGEYLTGRFEEQEVRRSFRTMDFANTKTLASRQAREALAIAVDFAKSQIVYDDPFLLAEGEHAAVLLDPDSLETFIERGEEVSDSITTVYLPFSAGRTFAQARERINEAWPPLIKTVEIKRSMKNGFAANLDYFRLDFLDRSMVETGGKLADILPALWMMAGARGRLPTCKGSEKMLFFKDCPLAVLVDESAIQPFLARLKDRPDVDWAFLVTNDQDSFSRMCEWLPEHIPAMQRVHLWRSYVDNFLINVDHASAGDAP